MHTNNLAEAIDSVQIAHQEAGRRSMETLLNCYCREVAGPEGQLSVIQPGKIRPRDQLHLYFL